MSASESAVCLSNASKSYGSGKSVKTVLIGLDMTISKGTIYGLLGASGCGKTTLLSCIAGRLKLDCGVLSVLGGVPGTKGSGVPGPLIGYMPQEVALVNEMSIKNTIYYFGWMFAMTPQQIASRLDFLVKLLELPPIDRLVRDLSGGQQRRVSFAAALVQTPELLILDEPTVGLDPVLRQSIWDYLVKVSKESGMTVLITTHYIEEATQADKVGLLREGKLLAEDAPRQLISRFQCETLEGVFLLLSQKQSDGELMDSFPDQECAGVDEVCVTGSSVKGGNIPGGVNFEQLRAERPKATSRHRLKALLYKDFLSFMRNTSGLMFLFVFPFLQMSTFFLAVGDDPFGMHLGVVNYETSNCSDVIGELRTQGFYVDEDDGELECHFYGLGCLFLEKLNDGTVINVEYEDLESALAGSRKLETAGTLFIPSNFSSYFESRRYDATKITEEMTEKGSIQVWLDMTSPVVAYRIKKHMYDKYAEVMQQVADNCNISRNELKIPVQFEEPVYGKNDTTFKDFMAPGIISTIAFFLSAMITATILTTDRYNGVWDRNAVAGATTAEILLSHCLCQIVSMTIQVTEIVVFGFHLFGMTCQGSIIEVICLICLQYISGLTYGLLVSGISKNTTEAIYYTIGSFLPLVMMNGSLWPLEGAPRLLQLIAYCAPTTWSTVALVNVLNRGWSFLNPHVWPGYAVAVAWIVGQFVFTTLILNKRS